VSEDSPRPFVRFTEGRDWMAAMLGVYATLPEREREELHAWEAENLDGATVGTSDWPGWAKYIGEPPWRERLAEGDDRTPSPGYVYVIKGNGLYKIGRTTQLAKRLTHFSTLFPVPITLVTAIPTDDPVSLEKRLQNQFSERRRSGEWFALSEADLDRIRHDYGSDET
jgi:hypothetical protein